MGASIPAFACRRALVKQSSLVFPAIRRVARYDFGVTTPTLPLLPVDSGGSLFAQPRRRDVFRYPPAGAAAGRRRSTEKHRRRWFSGMSPRRATRPQARVSARRDRQSAAAPGGSVTGLRCTRRRRHLDGARPSVFFASPSRRSEARGRRRRRRPAGFGQQQSWHWRQAQTVQTRPSAAIRKKAAAWIRGRSSGRRRGLRRRGARELSSRGAGRARALGAGASAMAGRRPPRGRGGGRGEAAGGTAR